MPFHPSICPWVFLELYHCFFLYFGMVLKPIYNRAWQRWIFCKKNLPQNWKNHPKLIKTRVFLLIYWKILLIILLNLFYNKNFNYFLSSCMDSIFSAVFISEISAKMFSANQIAAFLIKHISRKIICMWVKIHIN